MNNAIWTVPASFRKLIVKKLSPVFKEAVELITHPIVRPSSHEVLIKNKFVGINASDIEAATGHVSNASPSLFNIGCEGIGEIADFGEEVEDLKHGQPVMYMAPDAFAEYVYVPATEVIPITLLTPKFLPLLISGVKAIMSLHKCGSIIPGEKVLITSAAGDIGHIAVQWAKSSDCHVIGLCSSQEKVKFLQYIGCDRPINYSKENLEKVLHTEYPNGIDIVLENTKGNFINILLNNIAVKGRFVMTDILSDQIVERNMLATSDYIIKKLLQQSASLNGFFLPHYRADIPHYLTLLVKNLYEQKLETCIDDGSSHGRAFQGIEDIPKAMEYLLDDKNIGKVYVTL